MTLFFRFLSMMVLFAASAAVPMSVPSAVWAQADNEDHAEAGLDPGGSTDAKVEGEDSEEPIIDSAAVGEAQSIGKKYVRFHMWDGAVVGGDVSVDRLLVQTEFGTLEIPIEKLRSFYPGLDSFPERKRMIDTLVEQLGDRDYGVREEAHI